MWAETHASSMSALHVIGLLRVVVPIFIVVLSCVVTTVTLYKRIHCNRFNQRPIMSSSTGNSLRMTKKVGLYSVF